MQSYLMAKSAQVVQAKQCQHRRSGETRMQQPTGQIQNNQACAGGLNAEVSQPVKGAL